VGFRSASLIVAFAAATIPTSSPAIAGQAEQTEAVTSAQCELHVWPSSGLRSVYYGWFHGGIVDGAVTGRQGYPVVPKDPVPTELQVEKLSGMKLIEVLKLPGYQVVVHKEALDSARIRSTKGRLAEATTPCYAELVGDDVFFQQDVFSGSYLKSLIRFRSFGSGDTPIRTFGTWTETKLQVFPPKEDSLNAAALDELHRAYVSNIESFAAFLNRPAKKKK